MSFAAAKENALRTTLAAGEVLVDAGSGSRFRVTGFIGKGAMGEVYRGEAEANGAVVAIKIIPLALANDPKIALRTRFESTALLELRHRNVVPVLSSGVREDGIVFMVMRYLQGMTLLELRRTQGRIPIAWALEIVRDACRGLSAVHEHAVHRDVKPANLHFGVDAILRVLDLGAAKWKRSGMRLTSVGTQLGTLAYMAPEALDDSAPIDAQADLWSAGVVLYELLADRHPFAFDGKLPDNPFLLGNRILDTPHLPLRDVAPLCPGYLARIVDRMLAKNPRDRHRSAVELAEALSEAMRIFAHEHGAARPLEELAAQTFADAARRDSTGGATGVRDVSHLKTTAPLGPHAARAQPTALPYLRTEELPPSIVEAANRVLGKPAAPAGEAPAAPGGRASEPEPPRVSDVFPKGARLRPTLSDPGVATEPKVRDGFAVGADVALAVAAPEPAASGAVRGRRRGVLVGVGALAVVAIGAAGGLVWWMDAGSDAPQAAGIAVPGIAVPPAAPSLATITPDAPPTARTAAPSASSPPRRGAGPGARPGR